MSISEDTPAEVDPEAIATMRAQLEQMGDLLPEETTDQLRDLLAQMEAGTISEADAQAEAAKVYEGMLGAIAGLGADPAALGLPSPSDDLDHLGTPTDDQVARAAAEAVIGAEGVPGVSGSALVEALTRAEQLGVAVQLSPIHAGELADLANFAVWARDELRPTLEGLKPLVQRIAEVGPELKNAGPLQLAQLLLGAFGKTPPA